MNQLGTMSQVARPAPWQIAAFVVAVLLAAAGMSGSAQTERDIHRSVSTSCRRDEEIALAKSAAPANISDHATIEVLTESGFQVVNEGDNGFVCLVMRGLVGADLHPGAVPRSGLRPNGPRADLLRPGSLHGP